MAFDPITGMLIGGGLSAIGGLLGGNSASQQAKADRQAAQEQRDALEQQSVLMNWQRMLQLYGNENDAYNALSPMLSSQQNEKFFGRAAKDASFSDADRRRLSDIQGEMDALRRGNGPSVFGAGNPNRRNMNSNTQSQLQRLQAEYDAINSRSGGDPGVTGLIRRTGQSIPGGGLLAQYQALAGQDAARTKGLLGQFDSDTASGLAGYDDLISQANQYGAGQEARIRRDQAQQEKRLNQAAMAKLAASGVGDSTLALQALNSNSRSTNQNAQDRILDLNDSRMDRVLGLGSQKQSALGGRLNTRAGILGAGADNQRQMSLLPLQLQSDVLLNPYKQEITPLSNASGSAAFGSVIGNSLGSIGGTLGGLGLQQWLTSQGGQRRNPMGSANTNNASSYL